MEHVKTGKAVTRHDISAHIGGIRQGNRTGNAAENSGALDNGMATAERSTGISADDHGPIDPRMPSLTPA